MISGQKAADVREEGEDEEEEQQVQAVKPESKKKR